MLGRALAASSTLTALDLSNCGITAGSVGSVEHLAEGVGRSASLATLQLSGNLMDLRPVGAARDTQMRRAPSLASSRRPVNAQ